MSRGQRPRWPEFFPAMKRRGKGRRRRALRVMVWDDHGNPVWPPMLNVAGQMIRVDRGALRFGGRVLTAETAPYWVDVDDV
ncbi:hypothetical protein [Nocardia wallacei]|uniref:hypothetical protein n=1 Tax=Nocardia wallacei TaxID=480035 RepID=UPI00245475FE|nr:hypothetical protein [Nocardia wallacei]